MRTATDTPEERLAEYRRLFARALIRRERRADSVVLWFHAGAREPVEDLARREAACCPFLDYRVEAAGDEVVWTIANPGRGAGAEATLDAFHALPEGELAPTRNEGARTTV
jgi:hypothetical protein